MSDDKRLKHAKKPEGGHEDGETEFYSSQEHDGWGPIVKRSTPPPEPPPTQR